MTFLNAPETESSTYADRARFTFVWRLSIFISIALSVIAVLYFIIGRPNAIPFTVCAAVGILSLIILSKFRSYKPSAILITIFGLLAVNVSIFLIVDGVHIGTLLWMAVICMFTYFTLGKHWGQLVLLINALSYTRYIIFQLESNLENLAPFTTEISITLSLEIAICLLVIAYLAQLFIKTNKFVENQHKKANEELKEQYQIISTQNKEMEMMLKEIHHRVKNNLQVITSLLRLQSYELDEEKSKEFREAINRVKAMALIHKKMYQTEELSNLQIENYLESLANELIETYSFEVPIQVIINSEIKQVGSKTIVPLALLFNELISNSIKHAFSDISSAKIEVNLKMGEEGYFLMNYKDNGHWKSPEKDATFGLELIKTMTEQLDGEQEILKSETGTEFSFKLKNMEEDPLIALAKS